MYRLLIAQLVYVIWSSSFQAPASRSLSSSIMNEVVHGSNSAEVATNITELVLELYKGRANFQILFDSTNNETAYGFQKGVTSDYSALIMFQYENSSEMINQMLKSAASRTIFVTFCTFQNIFNIFKIIKTNRLRSHLVEWFLLFQWEEEKEENLTGLQKMVFEGTRVTLVWETVNSLYHVYSTHVDDEGLISFLYRASWSSNSDKRMPQIQMTSNMGDKYYHMNGRKLVFAVNHAPPYFALGGQNPDGTYQATGGYELHLLEYIRETMNFTYSLVRPPDGAWGYPEPDGTISGMIGMVARREVHMALTAIAINEKRASVVEYSIPYLQELLGLWSRAPKQKNRELAILLPFTLQVWICILISILAMGPLLKFQSILTQVFTGNRSVKLEAFSFNIFRNIVVQGNLLKTQRWSQRVLFFFWYIFCLIVSALYSGTLTAVLAIPAYEKPIDSLQDLPRAVAEGFTLTVMGGSTNEYVFKYATGGIYKQTWQLFNHEERSKSFLSNIGIAMNMVLENKTVFIIPGISGKLYAGRLGRNKFHKSRDDFFPQIDGFAFPPGAPYVGTMNKRIQAAFETGLVSKWIEDEVNKDRKRVVDIDDTQMVISLAHLQAAFFLLFLGLVIAALAFVFERFYFSWK